MFIILHDTLQQDLQSINCGRRNLFCLPPRHDNCI